MPTISLINDSGSLPSGLSAQVGDQAFVRDRSMRYNYLDLSLVSSRSMTFSGNGVVVDAIDSSGNSPNTSPFTSNENFSQSYFSNIGTASSQPLLSYTIDSNQITPQFHNRFRHNSPYISVNTSSNILIRPTSFLLDGDSTLRLDATGDSNGILNDASFWKDSTGSIEIDLQHDSANFDSFHQPWKIHTFLKDVSEFTSTDRAVPFRYNYGVANVDGVLTWKQGEVLHNGVRYEPSAKNGGSSSTATSSFLNHFVHSALEYDGQGELTQHYNGSSYNMVPDSKYLFSAGSLLSKNFDLNRDATFRSRVYIPSTMNADAVLFTFGNGTGNTTEIKFDAGTQKLEGICRQLSTNGSIAAYMDDAYHDITWVIQINPARLSVYIDGNKVLATGASGQLTNGKWAEGGVSGVTSLDVNFASDIVYQPNHVNTESLSWNNLVNSTRVHNGNVYINTTMNDRETYFLIDKTIPIGASKFYYFEMDWVGIHGYPNKSYSYLQPCLTDAKWNGDPGSVGNTNGPRINSTSWTGDRFVTSLKENPSMNHTGRLMKTIDTSRSNTGFLRDDSRLQVLFDPVEGLCWCAYNGRFFQNNYGPYTVTGESQRLNPTGLGYTPGQQNGLPAQAHLDNPGWKFAFNIRDYAANQQGTNNSYRFVRVASGTGSTAGDAEVIVRFNEDDWVFSPLEILQEIKTRVEADPSDYNLPSGFTYDISRVGNEGIYAELGATISPWPKNGSEPHGQLRYFPQTLKGLAESPMKFGSGKLPINPHGQTGLAFAQKYVDRTGGTLRQINTGNYAEIYDYIKNIVQEGDAVVLAPGHYSYTDTDTTVNAAALSYKIESTPFGRPHKNFLICGSTSNPGDVKICFYPLGYSNSFAQYNNYHVRAPIYGSQATNDCGLAFLTMQRFKYNYYRDRVAVHYNSKGGFAESVIFDFANNEYGPDAEQYTYNKFQLVYDENSRYVFANGNRRFRFFRNCHFKNYGNNIRAAYVERFTDVSGLYTAYWSFHMENCAFASNTDALTNIGVEKRGLWIQEALMDSHGASDTNFHGYINNINLRSNYGDSSEAINSSVVSSDSNHGSKILQWMSSFDNNNRLLLDARFKEPEVLKVETNGKVFTKKRLRGDYSNNVGDWNFNTLEWDKNTNIAKMSKNGDSLSQINNFFDSHNISDTRLVLGGAYKFVAASTPRFDYISAVSGDTLKDIHLSKAIRFDSSSYSIPTTEPTRTSDTVLITSQGQDVDSTQAVIQVAPSFNEFSPYNTGQRGWKKVSVTRKVWDSAQILNLYDLEKNGGIFPDSHNDGRGNKFSHSQPEQPGHGWDGNLNDVFLTYDSNFLTGISDSANSRFDVEVQLANIDANGKSISWSYQDKQHPRAARIGVDSTGYNYIISKFQTDFTMKNPEALIRFTPHMTDSTDSSQIMMNYIQNESEKKPFSTVDIYYDRFEASLVINEGQGTSSFAEISVLPPGRDPSMYTYDSDMIPSSMNIASNIFIYDSLGALPT